MTNEQEIERIEQIIKDIDRPWKRYGVRASSPSYGYIRALVNAGIGDKKQALTEFAENLKEKSNQMSDSARIFFNAIIDETLKELGYADLS